MKVLKHHDVEEDIVLSSDSYYRLVIQNPIYLRKAIQALKTQIDSDDGDILYLVDGKEEKLSKDAYFIENPLDFDLDEKKLSGLIQKDLSSHISYSQKEAYETLMNQITEYLKSISYDYPIPLSFDTDISLAAFLKDAGITGVAQEEESFCDRILNEVKKLVFLLHINLFFFLNLEDYLTEEEQKLLFHSFRLLEVDFVLLSTHEKNPLLPDEKEIIIDKDLCELSVDGKSTES